MKNILIHTLATTWEEPPRARHQVTNELKKEAKIYFIIGKNKIGNPRIELETVEPNVVTITPYFWIDYRIRYRIPIINDLYNKWLFKCIKDLNIDFAFTVTFDFTAPEIHNYFKNIIFYCADDNVGLGKFTPSFVISYHTKTEKKVAEKSQVCIVTSEYMLTKIKEYNNSTFLVPLGAPEIKLPAFFKDPKSDYPVLGLVGYLDKNMDYPLLRHLLQKFQIIFIGPVSEKIKKEFQLFPNANFVGVKTGDELYHLLETIDVCIAPYDVSIINKGLTPNKMWLYLAAGKPVVVTDIPNIKSWIFDDKLVYKCENKDFQEKCLAAYRDNNPVLTQKRVEVAKNNSWNKRVKMIMDCFNSSKNQHCNV